MVKCSEWAPAQRPNKVAPGATLAKTNEQMAADAGVTPRTIRQAKAAQKAGLGDAVRDGAMTAKEAANVAAGEPAKPAKKPEQKAAAKVVEQPAVQPIEHDQDAVQILSEENYRLNDCLAVVARGCHTRRAFGCHRHDFKPSRRAQDHEH